MRSETISFLMFVDAVSGTRLGLNLSTNVASGKIDLISQYVPYVSAQYL
jgi:hypothetical protein